MVAQLEFREEHKTCTTNGTLHDALQIRERLRSVRRLEKFDDVRSADGRLERGHNGFEPFGTSVAATTI
jgi:hypothetical protein